MLAVQTVVDLLQLVINTYVFFFAFVFCNLAQRSHSFVMIFKQLRNVIQKSAFDNFALIQKVSAYWTLFFLLNDPFEQASSACKA